ncbi:MAG: aminotransferase class III-fold pyridoxal phosphate-dependent enzyme [Cytophagales bacterium]|nr:aminotransferase class III-fold pyridoxal phosphate-dependent enzyme [Cytophagales bacterium]
MNLFDVYPRFDVNLTSGKGCKVFAGEQEYLDMYGGHGVISIGHSHPHYVQTLQEQIEQLGFYSNSVHMSVQEKLALKLGEMSGYEEYSLFLCNSGAEANENALKLSSMSTGKKTVVAFRNSFHGRTAASLNVTDNEKLSAPLNRDNFPVRFVSMNCTAELDEALSPGDVCAVIIEPVQGVGGLDLAGNDFLQYLEKACRKHNVFLIADEIQCGFGRSGKFFAHQYAGIQADIVTVAKGMGNGFPVAGVLISPCIKASFGQLGTTFGGNPMACAAGLSVLETIDQEKLIVNAEAMGEYARSQLKKIPEVKQVKGKGLMLGALFDFPVRELRSRLVKEYFIFTGASSNPNLLRVLPPLCVTAQEIDLFINALKKLLI